MKKSTRDFIKEARTAKDYSFFDLLHGYFYMRWPYFYIAMGKGDHPLSKKLSGILSNVIGFFEKFHQKEC